jgi:addiction module RelE/StbE family toxin
MVRLNWTEQSVEDLNSIAEYIARDSVKYAKLQIKRIQFRARQLKKQPQSGRIVPETDDPSIKELIIGNYRIVYKIRSKSRIDILTIHHSARLLKPEALK